MATWPRPSCRSFAASALLLAGACALTTGCAPAVRAGAHHAGALYTPARVARGAVYRVFPPPPGCGEAGPPLGPSGAAGGAERSGTIVLLPALGFSGQMWQATLSRLRACRARVVVDLPGLGEDRPLAEVEAGAVLDALMAVIDAESPGAPVVIAGSSIGGVLAARLAARAPERVAALIFVDAPLMPYEVKARWKWLALKPALWGPLYDLGGPAAMLRLSFRRFGSVPTDDTTVAYMARQLAEPRRRLTMLGYFRAFLDTEALDETRLALGRVRGPVLLVTGDHDAVVPPSLIVDAAHALKAAGPVTRKTLPGGHLPGLDSPQALAQAIDEFLGQITEVAHLPAAPVDPTARRVAPGGLKPGQLVYGRRHEWFPIGGWTLLLSLDGRKDVAPVFGVARGGIARGYPLESGRVVWTAGFGLHSDPVNDKSWSPAYLRSTLRLELVWRWAGGFHLDGTLMVDPMPERLYRMGGYGAIGYTPSVLPWVRAFVGYGNFPGTEPRVMFGVEIDARLNGLMY